ncbi:uncharacterized protein LOC101889317 [Musca domestica]|uniref:Uncharacterized protein LOC101889317 n=1 Tax=Musca domestica TaxID=7370 RepID=A0A9J7I9X7_MUSDO|nr:uncharacterized protein LOC101889317 [Musca domestica]
MTPVKPECQMSYHLKVWLTILLVIKLCCGLTVYGNGFVTIKRLPPPELCRNDACLEDVAGRDQRQRSFLEMKYRLYENPYKLRFQPMKAMPRLFWHKFPQKQQELPTTTVMPTEVPEVTELPSEPEEPTESTEEPMEPEITEAPIPETEAPPPTEPPAPPPTEPATEEPMVTEIPTIMPTSTISETPLRPPGTTFTTIMKPPGYFPYNLATKLKNLLVFGSPAQVNLIQKHGLVPTVKTKSKGFLSLFEVIKFENVRCSVNMGDIRSMEGTCYHELECKNLGGIPTERCADGAGVCCIFLTGCGDTTDQSVVYFESPNYPHPFRESMICVLIVNVRKNVQQLRLDFLMFELNRPIDGDCEEDQFVVSGQNINFEVPVLCGINTGHLMYVHVGHSPDRKVYLSIFAKVPTGSRSFNLKITQLEDNLAPDGCLQYYTDMEGIVKSFNYDIEGTVVDNKLATYLNNLNYVICLERGKNTCSVNYVMEQIGSSSEQLDFQIINKNEDENDLVPDGQAGAGIFNCPDDFLAINQVRLCGERFNDGSTNEDFTVNAPVRDVAAGPIILPFRSNDEYVGRGFRLSYRQESCV